MVDTCRVFFIRSQLLYGRRVNALIRLQHVGSTARVHVPHCTALLHLSAGHMLIPAWHWFIIGHGETPRVFSSSAVCGRRPSPTEHVCRRNSCIMQLNYNGLCISWRRGYQPFTRLRRCPCSAIVSRVRRSRLLTCEYASDRVGLLSESK